jgi:hypothetical protein
MAEAIKFVEGTDFHHYAIGFNYYVIEACPQGVILITLKEFQDKYLIKEDVQINFDISFDHVLNFFESHAHAKYGYLQNFFILLKRLRLIRRYPNWAVKDIICSELVMLFFKEFCTIKPDDVNVGLRETEAFLAYVKNGLAAITFR